MYYYSNNLQVLNIDEQKWMLATVGQVHRWLVQRKEIQHMVISFSETEPLSTAFQFQRCTKNGQIYCLGNLIDIKLNVWNWLKYRAIFFRKGSILYLCSRESGPDRHARWSSVIMTSKPLSSRRWSLLMLIPPSHLVWWALRLVLKSFLQWRLKVI